MGQISKTLTGARCKLYINQRLVGYFTQVSWGVNLGATDIHTLGNYGAQEIVYTDMETITVNLSGFRIMKNGPYAGMAFPKLQDMLRHEDIVLNIEDKQSTGSDANVMTLVGARPISFSKGVGARGVATLDGTYRGLLLTDESGPQGEVDGVPYA